MIPKRTITYLLLAVSLFIIEALIAMYLKSGFIRHTFGDYLVAILMYCFFKIFIREKHFTIAISVLVFAFVIEFLQLINILEMLNLQNNQLIKLVLGSSFSISDLMAYTLGIVTVLFIEFKIYKLWIR